MSLGDRRVVAKVDEDDLRQGLMKPPGPLPGYAAAPYDARLCEDVLYLFPLRSRYSPQCRLTRTYAPIRRRAG
jgi:hypothetical protein